MCYTVKRSSYEYNSQWFMSLWKIYIIEIYKFMGIECPLDITEGTHKRHHITHPRWWGIGSFVNSISTLRWRHNGLDGVSNHQPHGCLLNRLFRRGSKKTSKLCAAGLCVGNSPATGEFPAQMASDAENVSIWWRHHEPILCRFDSVVICTLLWKMDHHVVQKYINTIIKSQ